MTEPLKPARFLDEAVRWCHCTASDSRAYSGLMARNWIEILHAGGGRIEEEIQVDVISCGLSQPGIAPSPKIPPAQGDVLGPNNVLIVNCSQAIAKGSVHTAMTACLCALSAGQMGLTREVTASSNIDRVGRCYRSGEPSFYIEI